MNRPMDLIEDLNFVWKKLGESSGEQFEEMFKNLISHAYVEIENEIIKYCKEQGKEYKNFMFYGIQDLLISFMSADDSLLRQEYNAYCKFCDWAKVEPLSPEDVITRNKDITKDNLIATINLIRSCRKSLDPAKFNAFIIALEFFCLMGDNEMDENEFYLISCFYEDGYDVAPTDWKAFQKESKKINAKW